VTWKVYAQRRLKREQNLIGGNVFYAFGSLSRAMQGAGDGVSQVELEEDNQLGTYWGWLARGGDRPYYISDSKESLAAEFSGGDRTRRIEDSVNYGCGRILRLSVKELAEVNG
jgi:hypothetical protein